MIDPLAPAVLVRHAATNPRVRDHIERMADLTDEVIEAVRELDQLRAQTHRLIEGEAAPVDVILPDGGVVSASDIERLLGERGLRVHDVRFRRALEQRTISWSAFGTDGNQVRGTVNVRVDREGEDEVVVSVEIVVDGEPGERVVVAELSDPEVRLRQVANQARALITRIRRDRDVEWRDVISALSNIVAGAEG